MSKLVCEAIDVAEVARQLCPDFGMGGILWRKGFWDGAKGNPFRDDLATKGVWAEYKTGYDAGQRWEAGRQQ